MIDNFDLLAVLLSFIAGINLVISRTLNAKLAEKTSIRIGTFYNYLIGLLITIPVYFLLVRNMIGGFFVAIGLSVNLLLDKKTSPSSYAHNAENQHTQRRGSGVNSE